MFFLIGGIQPKRIRLEKPGRVCPRCSHPGLYAKRVDHYFNLFFIPLFRVKRGVPFVCCDRCHSVFDERGMTIEEPAAFSRAAWRCPDCGRPLEEDFEHCPRCGRKVRRP